MRDVWTMLAPALRAAWYAVCCELSSMRVAGDVGVLGLGELHHRGLLDLGHAARAPRRAGSAGRR